jgi:hypothetical protein
MRKELLYLFDEPEFIHLRKTLRQFLGGTALTQIWQRRRSVTLEKQLVQRNLQRDGEPLQRFEGRDSVAILYPGNIATQ